MSRRPVIILGIAILALGVSGPLGAQILGAGYQIARSNHQDMLQSGGVDLRLRFRTIDFHYDHMTSHIQRFESPCGGFIPPDCGPETTNVSSRLHSVFISARARLLSRGSFDLLVLPEAGIVFGNITKRSAATGQVGASSRGGAPGAGVGLELSASRVGGTPIGGWIAGRFRGFIHPGPIALDAYQPHRELDWIRSMELGLTVALSAARP